MQWFVSADASVCASHYVYSGHIQSSFGILFPMAPLSADYSGQNLCHHWVCYPPLFLSFSHSLSLFLSFVFLSLSLPLSVLLNLSVFSLFLFLSLFLCLSLYRMIVSL